MSGDLVPQQPDKQNLPVAAQQIQTQLSSLQAAFQQAGVHEKIDATRFQEFNRRKSKNTLAGYRRDLQRMADLLLPNAGDDAGLQLSLFPALWRDIDETVVYAYRSRMESEGYALSSINRALCAVRSYAKLAMLSQVMPSEAYAKIAAIKGYSDKEAASLDQKRDYTRRAQVDENATGKKAEAVRIPDDIFHDLMTDHDLDTYAGLRAAVVIRILAELGLRAGELAGIERKQVNLMAGSIRFYREKVHKTQTMKISRRLMKLLRLYMDVFPRGKYLTWKLSPAGKPLQCDPDENGLSRAGISMLVKQQGRRFGLGKLSAHDLRHHWTTAQHRNGVDSVQLQRMGGWSSPAMLQTYIEEMDDVNDGHESPYDI